VKVTDMYSQNTADARPSAPLLLNVLRRDRIGDVQKYSFQEFIMGDAEILAVFIDEAREIIQNLESDIVKLEEDSSNEETINQVFRYFHTLKGSSGIAGVTSVYEFTHRLENLLDDVRGGDLAVTDKLIDLILDSIDWVKGEINMSDEVPENQDEVRANLLEQINLFKGIDESNITSLATQPVVKGISTNRFYRVKISLREDIFLFGIDPMLLIEDLLAMGDLVTKTVDRSGIPAFEKMDPEICYISWDIIIKSRKSIDAIRNVFLFVLDDDNRISIEDVTDKFSETESGDILTEEVRIGDLLVKKGILSEEALDEVISIQDDGKLLLGDIVVKQGLATEKQVTEALQEQEQIKKKIETSTIRVDTTKLDNLMNLLGEIVIGQSSLTRVSEEMEDEIGTRIKSAIHSVDRVTREFQEQIMAIRMIPVGPTFEQFRRFVRDSAHSMGKEISLAIEGGETELDKTVIEKIGDPLKHMIRNAIDHGIEDKKIREKAGKPASGNITLRAFHQEGNVFIEIVDDGGGISVERVREKAEGLGLIKPDEEITKEKLFSFLFNPGFSTAAKIGDLSGRGVGMDVVKTNIESLRGNVEIRSEEGRGTIVRIKLPLTLAIIDGMLVSIGKYTYIIPLLSVLESIRPKKEEIKTIEGKGEVILVRGEYVSLIRLYDVFGVEAEHQDPSKGLVVIVESGTTRVGLLIDDLLGQQQIVIKSLDNFITTSRAVSGAAILGDGKVALIIDIFGLVEDIIQ